MIDRALIKEAIKAVQSKQRHHVTPAQLLAVVMQESHGVPYFVDTKPCSLYSANVAGAVKYWKRRKKPDGSIESLGPFYTGLKVAEIRELITIPNNINDWIVPKAMRGQPAKFRFEYSYWEDPKYKNLTPDDRFYISSSWGLVQFMGPNIIGHRTDKEGIEFIRRFAADVPLQLVYGAGMLDQLLERTQGNLDRAYRGYNSGNVDSKNSDVVARAKEVVRWHQQIEQQLKEENHV